VSAPAPNVTAPAPNVTAPAPKRKNTFSVSLLRRLYSSFRGQLGGAVLLSVLSMLAAVLEVASITLLVLLGKLTAEGKHTYVGDLGWLSEPMEVSLGTLVLIGFGVILVRVGLQVWATWVDAKMSSDYMAEQRNRLFSSFIEASWEGKSDTRAADLQNMLTSHVDRATYLLASLSGGIASLGNVIVLMISAILLSWLFALGIFAIAVVLFVVLRPLSKWAKRAGHADAASHSGYARQVNQAVTVAREIEVFHVGGEVNRRVGELVEENRHKSRIAMLAQRLLSPLYQNFVMLMAFGAMATVAIGGMGRVEVLGIIVLIMLRMASYTQVLQSVYHHVVGKSIFLDELVEAEQKNREATHAPGTREVAHIETLTLDEVGFAYKPDVPVLQGLSLEIRYGESIGVVGASGAGKSTLIKLLLGLHSPQQGRILVNGIPLRDLARDSWYRRIAYVPQEPHLIDDSAAGNICFYRDYTAAEVEAAARRAHIHDAIAALPQGYASNLGDQGGELSGGQRQRICIARALIGQPDLLILDEPTSALDAFSEEAIQKTLQAIHGKTTTLIIAHRLSMLEHCDRVLVMHEGRIQAFDTPERLSATSEFYRRSKALLRA
jgi:ATP-binding cassette, subfamily B, bacterial